MGNHTETLKNDLLTRPWGTSSEVCLRKRLERNERDIAQFVDKLHSYSFEPKTYAQFEQLADLKDEARELRVANGEITMALQDTAVSTLRCSALFQRHLQHFEVYSQAVRDYMEETKLHQTACF